MGDSVSNLSNSAIVQHFIASRTGLKIDSELAVWLSLATPVTRIELSHHEEHWVKTIHGVKSFLTQPVNGRCDVDVKEQQGQRRVAYSRVSEECTSTSTTLQRVGAYARHLCVRATACCAWLYLGS